MTADVLSPNRRFGHQATPTEEQTPACAQQSTSMQLPLAIFSRAACNEGSASCIKEANSHRRRKEQHAECHVDKTTFYLLLFGEAITFHKMPVSCSNLHLRRIVADLRRTNVFVII